MSEKVTQLSMLPGFTGAEVVYVALGGVDYQGTVTSLQQFLLFSSQLTGNPTAPTQPLNDNSTHVATTEYVDRITVNFAPVNSPAFTGNPTAPTQTDMNNSTRLATTQYLDRLRGAVNGIATLDGSGMVPLVQLPPSVIGGSLFISTWDASTNTPTIVNGTGVNGDYYIVATAGSTNIDGTSTWNLGDWVVFSSTVGKWQRVALTSLIPLSNLATQAANTFVANATGGAAVPTAINGATATSLLNAFVGDSGAGGTKGLVPAPASGDAAANKFLSASGAWAQVNLSLYAPLASPALTGTPTAPTAAPGTSTTQIATTAFVNISFAPLASPALTGVPTAPTAANGTNTTQLATCAFVLNNIPSVTAGSGISVAGMTVSIDTNNAAGIGAYAIIQPATSVSAGATVTADGANQKFMTVRGDNGTWQQNSNVPAGQVWRNMTGGNLNSGITEFGLFMRVS